MGDDFFVILLDFVLRLVYIANNVNVYVVFSVIL